MRPVTLVMCFLALLVLVVPGYARTAYSGTVVHEPSTYPANVRNAARAARLVNCQVIFPGQVFSFNAAVGPRTVANGFIPRKAMINGKFVYADVGSGICRTASALYQAALGAKLPIVEHHSHSYRVEYTLAETDTAIWWDTMDLKIRNDCSFPLLIRATTASSGVTVTLKEEHTDLFRLEQRLLHYRSSLM
ncbi:MAG: VanW family protein [Bacillota bacterium]|uniref:VanW family protein n=1 Tax=Desulforudis sp. DRI-14 TaxID=3459793 RepID=UPI00348A4301